MDQLDNHRSGFAVLLYGGSELSKHLKMLATRAVRYDDIYRMDEIKSIVSYYARSFISWCRKMHCLR